jgi:hypothetical protein
MAEADGNGISARLRRLPGQLLLSLINSTAILVIVAAIVTLVAIARINDFTENFVATMTEAVLSKVGLPPKNGLANLRNLTAEVRTLGDALREIKEGEFPALQLEIAQLKEALTVLNSSIDRLRSARSILTDEAIGQLGRTVTDALTKLKKCSSSARLMEQRTLRGKTVEAREPADLGGNALPIQILDLFEGPNRHTEKQYEPQAIGQIGLAGEIHPWIGHGRYAHATYKAKARDSPG